MKKRVELTVTLAPEKALTSRYAMKKAICYDMVKLAKENKAIDTTIYLVDDNGLEWGSVDIHKGRDNWINKFDFNLTFEHVNDCVDVATSYAIDVYKGKLDKEISDYEVNRY